jgi:endoglucanase Acf2
MRAGKVTEFAKRRFEQGNHNVNDYLAQVSDDVNGMPHHMSELVQTPREAELRNQLHESVKGLMNLNKKT